MASDPRAAAGAVEASLAQLLAVLWRRRAVVCAVTGLGLVAGLVYVLVTDPLYRATASVRPGITAYTGNGDPVREWKLKDITYWFGHGLYADRLRETFGWPRDWPPPRIDASFIPRGSQNIQGGDVVTLQVLSPDPRLAERILDESIAAFNAYAAADTVGSGLALTRAGLEVRLAALAGERERLDAKGERVALSRAEAEKQLEGLEAQRQRVGIEIERIATANRLRESLRAEARRQAAAAAADREGLERAMARLAAPTAGAAADSAAAAAGGLAPLLLESRRRDDSDAAGATALSSLALRRFEQQNLATADSLTYEIEVAKGAVRDLELKRDVDLEREKAAILARIGDLRLQQEKELAIERGALDQDARGRRAQLAVLAPLERIGPTQVSVRPVRPRKLRAVALLTLAGGLVSLAAAFAWDYLATHGDEILARRRGG